MKVYILGWLLTRHGFQCQEDDIICFDTDNSVRETPKAYLIPKDKFYKYDERTYKKCEKPLEQFGAWRNDTEQNIWIPKSQCSEVPVGNVDERYDDNEYPYGLDLGDIY